MTGIQRRANPWKNVKTLKRCNVHLRSSFDLSKSVEHKFVSFALNLLCVSKKYELIFISYGQYIYIFELKDFTDNNIYINEKYDTEKCYVFRNFNKKEIGKSNCGFTNMNKIRYVYEEIKKDLQLKKLNVPIPCLILSPHMYSKGYVNIKCEEKENFDKSILISAGWSEDTNIYYVEKFVECINIKKKLKHILEKKLYDCKRYEEIMTRELYYPYFPYNPNFHSFLNDPYCFLKKLKIDENNFILNLIYNNEYTENYSNEFLDMFELSKSVTNFDYMKNKVKEKRRILLHKLEMEKTKKSKKIKNKILIASNRNVHANSRNDVKYPFVQMKNKNVSKKIVNKKWRREKGVLTNDVHKKGLYRIKCKCMLKCPKDRSYNVFNSKIDKNIRNKTKRGKFKIADMYSSFESTQEEEEEGNEGAGEEKGQRQKENSHLRERTNRKNFKKHYYNYFLDDDTRGEIEEINFYKKMFNNVYIGYNLRNNVELNEQNDYINSFRQDNQFVNSYIKSSSDDENDSLTNCKSKLRKHKNERKGIKLGEHKEAHTFLVMKKRRKCKKHKQEEKEEEQQAEGEQTEKKKEKKKVQRNKPRKREKRNTKVNRTMRDDSSSPLTYNITSGRNKNFNIPSEKYKINIKKYKGDDRNIKLEYLNENIKKYMLYIDRLNTLKEERKKFVNFCKLYIKHKYYEEYSKKLEAFLDPSTKIKYNRIWKQFNIFTFNLFNVDHNDKILKYNHIYLQSDIVFNNKMYAKSDTSTWAISFNFTRNLLAIGSNTHNINIYNLNNFYYFRKRYDYDEAYNFFKNMFVYNKFKVSNLFPRDDKDRFYFNSSDDEKESFLIKKREKRKKKNNKIETKNKKYKHNNENKEHFLRQFNNDMKYSEQVIYLNLYEGKKFENNSNDVENIRDSNTQNQLSYNILQNDKKYKKKKRKKGGLSRSSENLWDSDINACVCNYLSDLMDERGGGKKKRKDTNKKNNINNNNNNNNNGNNYDLLDNNFPFERKKEKGFNYHLQNDDIYENYERKESAEVKGDQRAVSPFSFDCYDFPCANEVKAVKAVNAVTNDKDLNCSLHEDYIHICRKLKIKYFNDELELENDQKYGKNNTGKNTGTLHDSRVGDNSEKKSSYFTMSNMSYKKYDESHVNKMIRNILKKKSKIPIDLTLFFTSRKENLKNILLTISYNFPSDSIHIFLKEACMAKNIYTKKLNAPDNISLIINKMKRVYLKRYGSNEYFNIKLFSRDALVVNNKNFLKNWYLKYLCKNFFYLNDNEGSLQSRTGREEKMIKRGNLSMEEMKYMLISNEDGINKEDKASKYLKKKKGRDVYKKNEMVYNEKIKLINSNLYLHNKSSGEESFNNEDKSRIYCSKKRYNLLEIEKRYYILLPSYKVHHNIYNNVPLYNNFSECKKKIICLTYMYSYKRANMILKSISKKFRKFIKDRHNFTFFNTPQLFSNEQSIYIILDKKRSKENKKYHYENTSSKYINELKNVIKYIQSHTTPGLLYLKNQNGRKKKKKILIICELRDHNNNMLDTIHLTNATAEECSDTLSDSPSGQLGEENCVYYSFLYDKAEINNEKRKKRKKGLMSNNMNSSDKQKRKKKKKRKKTLESIIANKTHMSGIIKHTIEMEVNKLNENYSNFISQERKRKQKIKSIILNYNSSLNSKEESDNSDSSERSEEKEQLNNSVDYRAFHSSSINNTSIQNTSHLNRIINENLLHTRNRVIRNGYNSDVSNSGRLLVRALNNFRMLRNNFLNNIRNNVRPNRARDNVTDDIINESTHRFISTMVDATQNLLNINSSLSTYNIRAPNSVNDRDNVSSAAEVSNIPDTSNALDASNIPDASNAYNASNMTSVSLTNLPNIRLSNILSSRLSNLPSVNLDNILNAASRNDRNGSGRNDTNIEMDVYLDYMNPSHSNYYANLRTPISRSSNLRSPNSEILNLRGFNMGSLNARSLNSNRFSLRTPNNVNSNFRNSNVHNINLRNSNVRSINLRNSNVRSINLRTPSIHNNLYSNRILNNILRLSLNGRESNADILGIAINANNLDNINTSTNVVANVVNNNSNSSNNNGGNNNEINNNEISNNDISNNDISNNDISNNDISNNDISNNDISNNDISNNDISNNDISNNDISNNDISNNDISNNDISNNDISNNDISNNDISNNDISNNDISNNDISNNDISNNDISYNDSSNNDSSHNSNSSSNVQNAFEFRSDNDFMFLNIIYNNTLNTGVTNRNTSSTSVDTHNMPADGNVMNSRELYVAGLLQEFNINRNLNNNLFNGTFRNGPVLYIDNIKNENKLESLKCKEREEVKRRNQNKLFYEIPFSLKLACENKKYDATVRYIYTLSKSADDILLSCINNSEVLYDFVIICEGLYTENEEYLVDKAQEEEFEKNGIMYEKCREEEEVEEAEEVEYAQETRKIAQHEENKIKNENSFMGGSEFKGPLSRSSESIRSAITPFEKPSFPNYENNYISNSDLSNVYEGTELSYNSASYKYMQNCYLIKKKVDTINPFLDNGENTINLKNTFSNLSVDVLELSDESYYSCSSNTNSDFNEIIKSADECSECEYSNLCLEESNIINFTSAYQFLKKEHSILYANNCNVCIEKNKEGPITKYCLKREFLKERKKKFNGNTNIVTLRINDFQPDPIYHSANEYSNDKEEGIFLSPNGTNKGLNRRGRKNNNENDNTVIKSKWLQKVLLQENWYEYNEGEDEVMGKEREKLKENVKESVKEKVKTQQKEEDKGQLEINDYNSKHADRPMKRVNSLEVDEKGMLNNDNNTSNQLPRDNDLTRNNYTALKEDTEFEKTSNFSERKIKKYYNQNISSFIHYKAKEVRNYFYDEKYVKYFPYDDSNNINNMNKRNLLKKSFLNKLRSSPAYSLKQLLNEIFWTFSNVTFYTADWYDILYKLFFESSSRFYEIVIKHHEHNIPCVKFSPDDNFLLSCSVDKSLVLWNPFNVKNYDLDRSFNIYDYIFPPNVRRKDNPRCISRGSSNVRSRNNIRNENNYFSTSSCHLRGCLPRGRIKTYCLRRKTIFEKPFHETKMYKENIEKELMKKEKKNNIVCKQKLKSMGWSGDFIVKKYISDFDILVELFENQTFYLGAKFNYSSYFSFSNIDFNNFLPLFEKYSLFQLFRCTFLNSINKNKAVNLNNLTSYLYKMNLKKAECVEESTIKSVLDILTGNNCSDTCYSKEKIKRIYSAMKYVSRNLLKPYLLIYPLHDGNCYEMEKIKLKEENFTTYSCILTDYEFDFSSNDEQALKNFNDEEKSYKKNSLSHMISYKTGQVEKPRFTFSSYKNFENSNISYNQAYPMHNEAKRKTNRLYNKLDSDESDDDYIKRNKYENSLFYKYARKIRNDFSSNFSSRIGKNYDEVRKWIPIFQKLINQYADMKYCKDIYNHIKRKILINHINKYEATKPDLYFNFHITRNYQESKILNEILLNYSVYFSGKDRTISGVAACDRSNGGISNCIMVHGNMHRVSKHFKSYLKLIKKKRLLSNLRSSCWKGKKSMFPTTNQKEENKYNKRMNSAYDYNSKNKSFSNSKGYTIIMKSSVANFHNVINNIISLSHMNRIINHYKYFKENNMFNNGTRVTGNYKGSSSNHISSSRNHISSSRNHISSRRNHISSSSNHISSSRNHISSSSNHISSSRNHISSSSNHISSSRNHISSSRNHISSSRNHIDSNRNYSCNMSTNKKNVGVKDKRTKYTKNDILENFFNDFEEEEKTEFYSSDSFNSDVNEAQQKKWKRKGKKKGRKTKEMKKLKQLKRKKYSKYDHDKKPSLKKRDLKEILLRENKYYNICFLNSEKENYKINYFQNINILQNMYKFCGKGLIIVNVKYVMKNKLKNGGGTCAKNGDYKNDQSTGEKKVHHNGNMCSQLSSQRNGHQNGQRHSIVFQTDIHICKDKKRISRTNSNGKKGLNFKNPRTIIFIVRVNVEELRNYLVRKLIFEEKYINNNFYINRKVAKIFYLVTLKNCELLHKDDSSSTYETKIDEQKKKLLNSYMSKEEYSFYMHLTHNLFKKKNNQKFVLTRKEIYEDIIKIRNYILNPKRIEITPSILEEFTLPNYNGEHLNISNITYESSTFKLFFLLLPKYEQNVLMVNISTLRYLYSHMCNGEERKGKKRKGKKLCCCVNKNKDVFYPVVNKAEKKQLNEYLILSADKRKLYLLKVKFTKITKNFFTTKFIPISIQSLPKEHKLPSAFKSSRVSFLKIIYEKSCVLLANQYSNTIFIYVVNKCVYTNSYFLIPYFSLPLFTERIGKELIPGFNKDISCSIKKHVVNNVNYNLKRLPVGKPKDTDDESNFFIAGLDIIYVRGKNNNFEITVFAVLLSNITFCYKLNFHYY
ncbi:WD repeat-containing protein [Plasmodium brasilianum]|uniref:WD repeat-containing protein n=1 Tax=Plasmodium brasilianum TaxID=5824 RepID=A0ACB9Y361_PLABR|nr:WD repeat-containing protein [Plasmodium brasilianum]